LKFLLLLSNELDGKRGKYRLFIAGKNIGIDLVHHQILDNWCKFITLHLDQPDCRDFSI